MNIRFIIPAAYSVLSLCGSFNGIPCFSAPNADVGPVYNIYETDDESAKSSVGMISGMYIPGFDINKDGVFDSRDVEEINSSRIQKKKEQEDLKRKEETQNNDKQLTAELDAIEVTVPETPVLDEPEHTEETIETSSMPAPREMRGIDVSKWQGKIDWNSLKNDGIEFVMVKAGEGKEVAENFYTNIEGAKAAGIACGVYWFSNARSSAEAVSEANACLSVVSQYCLEFPVVCDFEYRSIEKCGNPLENNKAAATDAVLAFLDTIQQGGYYSMLYTNKNFSGQYYEFSRITDKYDIWCAGYSLSEPNMPCGIWQYSQSGFLDGIDIENVGRPIRAKVDLDTAYRDYPEIMKYLHINGY